MSNPIEEVEKTVEQRLDELEARANSAGMSYLRQVMQMTAIIGAFPIESRQITALFYSHVALFLICVINGVEIILLKNDVLTGNLSIVIAVAIIVLAIANLIFFSRIAAANAELEAHYKDKWIAGEANG